MRALSPPTPPVRATAPDATIEPDRPGAAAARPDDPPPRPVVGQVTHRIAVVNLERTQLGQLGRLLRR